jgi:hypothetical protein
MGFSFHSELQLVYRPLSRAGVWICDFAKITHILGKKHLCNYDLTFSLFFL